MTSSAAMVRMTGIRFAYGDGGFRIDIDDLEIAAGERVACIGPSGTGKTTLVNLVAGVTVAESGTVEVAGQSVSSLSDQERRALRISTIGMVFQQFELLEYLSALDNVLLPYRVTPALALTHDVHDRALALAQATGIEAVLGRRPARLSQGERQRVAICRALVTEPRLVICDEPTGNLDPKTATKTLDLLFDQVAARGATLLMVTHNHGILDRFDRVIDIERVGRVA